MVAIFESTDPRPYFRVRQADLHCNLCERQSVEEDPDPRLTPPPDPRSDLTVRAEDPGRVARPGGGRASGDVPVPQIP